jgi:hypothetical protein
MSDLRALGASVAKAQGHDPSSLTGDQLQAHGQAASDAMGKGKALPDLAEDAVAPEVAIPAQLASKALARKGATSKPSKQGGGLGKAARNVGSGATSFAGQSTGLMSGASPLGKVFSAVLAGWAVLEVGALLTGQSFKLSLLGRVPGTGGTTAGQPGTLASFANPSAASKTAFVPLYKGQAGDLTAILAGAPNAGAAAATSGQATGVIL